jgi:hypothetical protein
VLKAGITKEELGWNEFKAIADKELGNEPSMWHWSYYLRYPFNDDNSLLC